MSAQSEQGEREAIRRCTLVKARWIRWEKSSNCEETCLSRKDRKHTPGPPGYAFSLREGSRCEKTEAAIKKPIAAPALTLSGTRPPLRNLCVLPAVRAAGGGFRRRRGAPCACRCTLGRLFGLRDAARPRTCRYVIAHGMTDKVHVTNSWQSSRTCPMCMIVALCSIW